jgi:hypothetical protein
MILTLFYWEVPPACDIFYREWIHDSFFPVAQEYDPFVEDETMLDSGAAY